MLIETLGVFPCLAYMLDKLGKAKFCGSIGLATAYHCKTAVMTCSNTALLALVGCCVKYILLLGAYMLEPATLTLN